MLKKFALIAGFFLLASPLLANLPSSQELATSISPLEIREHVYYLASKGLEGRRTASPGARLASQYIAREFCKYGLQPGGDRGSYFQHFPITVGRKVQSSLKVVSSEKIRELGRGKDYDVYSFSGGGSFSGSVVFAGYGLETRTHNHYGKASVKDRVVLVLSGLPQGFSRKLPPRYRDYYNSPVSKATLAAKKGAKAVIVAVPQIGGKFQFKSLPGRKNLQLPIYYVSYGLLDQWGKEGGFSLTKWREILKTAKTFEAPTLALSFSGQVKVQFIKGFGRNVIGYIKGTDPTLSKEVVVFGAHFDHLGHGGSKSLAPGSREIHFGADDNASGTSALIEVAEALSLLDGVLQRTHVFIAFGGEEMGLLGSAYYAAHPTFKMKNTIGMINMDMVGRMRENKLIIMGSGTAKEWPALVTDANLPLGLKLNLTEKGGFGPSDHTSFYKNKVPVLFFFTGLHRDYHKPSDTPEKINYEGIARVAKMVFYTAMALEDHFGKLTYVKVVAPRKISRPHGKGPRPHFGVIPEYGEGDGSGLRISGATAGSPAQKAGFQAGDVIIQFGSAKIANIYDFTQALYAHKAGDKIKVVVVRKSKKITLEVTLGVR